MCVVYEQKESVSLCLPLPVSVSACLCLSLSVSVCSSRSPKNNSMFCVWGTTLNLTSVLHSLPPRFPVFIRDGLADREQEEALLRASKVVRCHVQRPGAAFTHVQTPPPSLARSCGLLGCALVLRSESSVHASVSPLAPHLFHRFSCVVCDGCRETRTLAGPLHSTACALSSHRSKPPHPLAVSAHTHAHTTHTQSYSLHVRASMPLPLATRRSFSRIHLCLFQPHAPSCVCVPVRVCGPLSAHVHHLYVCATCSASHDHQRRVVYHQHSRAAVDRRLQNRRRRQPVDYSRSGITCVCACACVRVCVCVCACVCVCFCLRNVRILL